MLCGNISIELTGPEGGAGDGCMQCKTRIMETTWMVTQIKGGRRPMLQNANLIPSLKTATGYSATVAMTLTELGNYNPIHTVPT
jgi:hypothetical protein